MMLSELLAEHGAPRNVHHGAVYCRSHFRHYRADKTLVLSSASGGTDLRATVSPDDSTAILHYYRGELSPRSALAGWTEIDTSTD
jgi:hypothetical protein